MSRFEIERFEIEEAYRQMVRVTLSCLLIGFAFFLSGAIAYSLGASILFAWGGLIAFGAICSSAAILLALTVREDGRLIANLQMENRARRAADARRIEVELRLADIAALAKHVSEDTSFSFRDGFLAELDYILRGDPGQSDRSEWTVRRRRAHLEHRDYLELPELPTLDGPRADEL